MMNGYMMTTVVVLKWATDAWVSVCEVHFKFIWASFMRHADGLSGTKPASMP